jgi:hypothetical protein
MIRSNSSGHNFASDHWPRIADAASWLARFVSK